MSELMQVTFQNIAGKKITLEIDPSQKISEIADEIVAKFDAKDSKIRFLYAGKNILETQSLSEVGYESGKSIIVHIQRPPQAAPPPRPVPSPPVQAPPPSSALPSSTAQSSTAQSPPSAVPSTLSSTPSITPSGPPSTTPSQTTATEAEQVIDQFLELGFTRAQIDFALREANGVVQYAAELLISGQIPSNIQLPTRNQQMTRPYNPGALNESFPIHQNVEFLRKMVIDEPNRNIHAILELTRSFNPQLSEKLQEDTAPMLRMLGVPAEKTQNGIVISNPQPPTGRHPPNPITDLLASFSSEEQEAVRRLTDMGYDLPTVIQVFNACDKDEIMTANCLASSKE